MGAAAAAAVLVLTLVASAAQALPTDLKREISTASQTDNLYSLQNNPLINPSAAVGTTSEPKKIVTYILGHPSKDAIKSPADLLRPDRYEFYTFDDDGKIIKKLMNIEEIQKILASSKENVQTETQPSNDFYQVLTVTPDIESIPTTNLNPHEPLFSIHDVIASVQNVLKAEIKDKMTQTPPTLVVDGFQNAHLVPDGEDLPPLKSTPPPKLAALQAEEKTSINELATDVKTDIETLDEQDKKVPEVVDITTENHVNTTTPAPSTTPVATTKTPITTTTIVTSKATPTTTTSAPTTIKIVTTTRKIPSQTTVKKPSVTTKKPPVTKKPESASQVKNAVNLASAKPTTVKIPTTTTAKPSSTTTKLTTTNGTTIPPRVVPQTISTKTNPTTLSTTPITTTTTTTTTSTTEATTTSSTTEKPSSTTELFDTTLRTMEEIIAELKSNNVTESSEDPTMVEILRVTSSVSHSSSPSSQIPAVTTLRPTPTTDVPVEVATTIAFDNDVATTPVPTTEAPSASETQTTFTVDATDEPFSLFDAHPGFTSSGETSNSTDSPFAIENLLLDNVTLLNATKANYIAESALNEVQIPMNEDLAESVSSVLSQIADEIAMNALNIEGNSITTVQPDTRESEDNYLTTTELPGTTDLPESWLKNAEDIILIEEDSEAPSTPEPFTTTTPPPIKPFKPQNQPRPFSKPTTTQPATTTIMNDAATTPQPEIEASTEADVTPLPDKEPTTIITTIQEEITTESVEAILSTVQPEKKSDPANSLQVIENNGNSNISIEIIQEAETGRIPRPTQSPGEVTTRPVSTTTTTTVGPSSTNKGNTIETIITTTSPNSANITTEPVPITTTPVSTTTDEPSTTHVLPNVEHVPTFEINPNDEVENITISFLPMVIHPSSSTPEPITHSESPVKHAPTEDHMQSKIIQEEIVEKSAPNSHNIIAISEEKAAPTKQTYVRPQKPQKPVFIKPTKGNKPQTVEGKPLSRPTRPPSSDEDQRPYETPLLSAPAALELDQAPIENLGLEATTVHLEPDVRDFVDLCNELAFSLWSSITHNGLSFVRSVVVSPFAVTSMLAMVFLGARGPTSGQMNDVLKLDDVVTFNPHLVFRNVTESLVIARHPGVSTAAFVRELYSDRSKGKLLEFYKERAQQFYDGHVEEINFKAVGESLRRQTNHLIRRQTWGKVRDFLQGSTLLLRPPLAAFTANIFQADCNRASTKDRDGEMYFVVLPSNRLRRLVPIPAAVWRDDFLAGYEPNLDATAAAVGSVGGIVSTIFVMPGQQGLIAPGDSLARLEHHLLGSSYQRGHWERLLRSLLRRPGLELQVPRINHKSVVNVTGSLVKMGLRDLFSSERADLTGLNGLANDLHLSDMVQVNQFSTCGDDSSNAQSHSEYYPASPLQRSSDNIFGESIESLFAVSDFEDPSISALPLELRPRQARLPSARTEGRSPDPPRLRLDRPFLFFVRHNPTGMILHVGRFNPRLMH